MPYVFSLVPDNPTDNNVLIWLIESEDKKKNSFENISLSLILLVINLTLF